MKKERITFTAVIEDEVQDESKLYSRSEQVHILNDILKKSIIGSKAMDVDVKYASREILEDDETEKVETLTDVPTYGSFECFHCLSRSVIWQSDFTFEDYGYEGEGIVQNLICMDCGAEIEYRVPIGKVEDGEYTGE